MKLLLALCIGALIGFAATDKPEPDYLVAKPGACDPAKTQVFNLRGQERAWQMNDPRAKCSLVLRGER